MNASLMICTYGDDEWMRRGVRTLDLTFDYGFDEAFTLHHPDGTLAEVRNAAAEAATCDWLCFLDADDELDTGYLSAMRAGTPLRVPEGGRYPPTLLVPSLQFTSGARRIGVPMIPAWDRSLIELNCAVIGTLIRRDLFLALGGFREWDAYEDWELWLRAVRAGATLVAVPDAVYLAHSVPEGRNLANKDARVKAYAAIRAEHRPHFNWADTAAYKTS